RADHPQAQQGGRAGVRPRARARLRRARGESAACQGEEHAETRGYPCRADASTGRGDRNPGARRGSGRRRCGVGGGCHAKARRGRTGRVDRVAVHRDVTEEALMPRLHRPGSLDEAVALLAELDNPMVYGGGTAIQILLKQGILYADNFVDLATVPGLDEVRSDERGVTVGPMVSLRRMEAIAPPLAAAAYRHVANPRVRNTASVGGNIAHGDYRLDPPTALLVLDAVALATSVQGTREIPVREFFTDFQQTALEPDELISGIRIPHQDRAA